MDIAKECHMVLSFADVRRRNFSEIHVV